MASLWFILALLVWFASVGCTFAKDGYRVWVGDRKDVDWIDVATEQSNTVPGWEGEWVITFADYSPIQEVVQLGGRGCQFFLKKAHSSWVLSSPTIHPEDYTLRRIDSVKGIAGVASPLQTPECCIRDLCPEKEIVCEHEVCGDCP